MNLFRIFSLLVLLNFGCSASAADDAPPDPQIRISNYKDLTYRRYSYHSSTIQWEVCKAIMDGESLWGVTK